LLAIPVLACLLDAKIMEYGLHARVISEFVENAFPFERSKHWERTFLGYSERHFERQLVKLRSATTVLVTVAPTTLIVMLDSILLYVRRENAWIMIAGVVLSLAYMRVAIFAVRMVWPSRNVDPAHSSGT
jgi:predicted tellurium resistance membrane protein TerC